MLFKVATYCRVSTSKEDQINSFERQMQMYEEEILCHDDWELYKAYYDKGASGTDVLNRAGFLEMMAAGLNNEYDILITREVSRLSRNIQQFYEFVRSLVKKNIDIYFIDDEINTKMPDFEIRAAGIISHAQDESRKTSQRVRRGQKIAMKNGVVHGTSLLGYDLTDGKLFINRNGAELVKSIFDMYVNKNMGIRQIKKHLEKFEIPTYKGKEIWSTKSILSILKNEKYCGDLIQGKTYTIDYLTHKKVKNTGNETKITNHHEAIIGREMWNKAQQLLNDKSPTHKNQNSLKYVLSGKIKCGECGKNYVSRTRKKDDGSIVKVWRCSSSVTQGKKTASAFGCNNSRQLRNDVAMDMLLKAMQTLEIDVNYVKNNLISIIKKSLKPSFDHNTENICFYYSELKKEKMRQKKLLESELSSRYLPEIIEEKLNENRNEIESIEKNIKLLESQNNILKNYNEFEFSLIKHIDNILIKKSFPDICLRTMLNRVVMYENQTAVVEIKHIKKPLFFYFE